MATDLSAETGGRPAISAPKHTSANSIVALDTVFNFTPRGDVFSIGVGMLTAFCIRASLLLVPLLRRGLVLGMVLLRFQDRI